MCCLSGAHDKKKEISHDSYSPQTVVGPLFVTIQMIAMVCKPLPLQSATLLYEGIQYVTGNGPNGFAERYGSSISSKNMFLMLRFSQVLSHDEGSSCVYACLSFRATHAQGTCTWQKLVSLYVYIFFPNTQHCVILLCIAI